jgi:glycosyltransferase involved in cell wall biosynthesis
VAAFTPPEFPLIVSVWGNDITLHGHGSFLMAALTRHTLKRADGFLADTMRDISLGQEWGFPTERPTLVVPGAGGIRLEDMSVSESAKEIEALIQELPDSPIVVNPRGQRPGSLRQDVFFQAIPLVLEKIPQAVFICPNLATDAESEHWVDELGIKLSTRLWPRLNQVQLWALLKKGQVFVSPSLHDGTPNSLLEAMACGCFPVVGNIDSMREWIQTGVNGLLVDATSPRSLADGIITALESPSLRVTAKNKNALIIADRAEYWHCMARVEAFYREILYSKNRRDL